MFAPLRRIPSEGPLALALRHGLALYSPHTALDAAPGGTNDFLASVLGLTGTRPVRPSPLASSGSSFKLITFVPGEARERLAEALFEAGAGVIGAYRSCSFFAPGTGTFWGGEGTQPAVGQAGRFEEVSEMRLETVVPAARLGDVVAALKRAHPYEEPAFDVVPLVSVAEGVGMGRIGAVEGSRREVIERVKAGLGVSHLLVAGPLEGPCRRGAVAAGSAGDLLAAAVDQGADVVLTGEVRHHDALSAASRGVLLLCALHSNSERGALGAYAARVRESAPGLEVRVSEVDRDPFVIL